MTINHKRQVRELIHVSKQQLFNYLENYRWNNDISYVPIYKMLVNKEKVIARTLCMFKNCGNYLVGLVWIPADRHSEFLDF